MESMLSTEQDQLNMSEDESDGDQFMAAMVHSDTESSALGASPMTHTVAVTDIDEYDHGMRETYFVLVLDRH